MRRSTRLAGNVVAIKRARKKGAIYGVVLSVIVCTPTLLQNFRPFFEYLLLTTIFTATLIAIAADRAARSQVTA